MDFFRPYFEPARTFYDVLIKEAKKRGQYESSDEWIDAERKVMWGAARDYAQQHNLRVPTLDDIKRVEGCAVGHVDYAAKFAYGVRDLVLGNLLG